MRQFSGFATPEETNARYRYLLEQGQTGLSVAFDLPTLMGYDADHPTARGEVGKCGVAISSLADMETLFRGIPLGDVTVSMTINSPASVLWAMYLVVAEQQGVDWARVSGTLQNDILKEYIAQKEYIYPPRPSMRLVTDTIEFAREVTPRFNPISICGYHIREAGSTAVQELAFTLRDGIEYVDWALERGLHVDSFAPRLSFFFNAHNDFFEEIAKYRAARKMWAHVMRDRYGAQDERSLETALPRADRRMFAHLAAAAEQHRADGDAGAWRPCWAVANPCTRIRWTKRTRCRREHAVTIALRTQQVIAYESGVPAVPDPLGGSYYLERLTLEMEAAANEYIRRIDEMGGMIRPLNAAFRRLRSPTPATNTSTQWRSGKASSSGVNQFTEATEQSIELLQIDETAERRQNERLAEVRKKRNSGEVEKSLDRSEASGGGHREHHALHSGCGSCVRHGGRNLRRAPGCVRGLHRNQCRVGL